MKSLQFIRELLQCFSRPPLRSESGLLLGRSVAWTISEHADDPTRVSARNSVRDYAPRGCKAPSFPPL